MSSTENNYIPFKKSPWFATGPYNGAPGNWIPSDYVARAALLELDIVRPIKAQIRLAQQQATVKQKWYF